MAQLYRSNAWGLVLCSFGLTVACSKTERDFGQILGGDSGAAGSTAIAGSAGAEGTARGGEANGGSAASISGASGEGNQQRAGSAGSGETGSSGAGAATPQGGAAGSTEATGGTAGSSGSAPTGGTVGSSGSAGAATGGTAGSSGSAGAAAAAPTGGTSGSGGRVGIGGTGGAAPTGGTAGAATGGEAATGGTAGTGGAATAGAAGEPACVPSETPETSCGDSVDNDCDGRADCGDLDCTDLLICCVKAETTESLCDNAADDDCDGLRDCEDSDCDGEVTCAPECVPTASTEVDCDGGVDEDCDDLTDCEDADDCSTAAECQPECIVISDPETACTGGDDDDCDGFVDCEDPDCAGDAACTPTCTPSTEVCTTSNDDDCDGYGGCLDSECAPTASCCTQTTPATEVNDGQDNDCDGLIDRPAILNAFPAIPPGTRLNWEGGAAAGDDVWFELDAPARSEYVLQCRTGKPASVALSNFQVCNPADPTATYVLPIDSSYANNPANDGVTVTQFRLAYPNGAVSEILTTPEYYIHSSMVGVELCPTKATDADYFAAAAPHLRADSTPTIAHAEARLASPFVNIDFAPPAHEKFEIADGDGPQEILTLRRRFVLDADRTMVLMKRIYASRRASTRRCLAAMIRKHDNDHGDDSDKDHTRYFRNGCDALVLNKEGAGVCLIVNTGGVAVLAYEPTSYWQTWNEVNWESADTLMWRKLVSHTANPTARRLFSPKCYSDGETCTGGNVHILYLPDRGLFDW